MILIKVAGAERHLRFSENGLLLLATRADLVVIYEEVSVLVLTMSIVYFLLQALDWLLVRPLVDCHEVAWMGQAVIAWLPRTATLSWDFIKIILRHASHFHRSHRMILLICKIIRFFRSI